MGGRLRNVNLAKDGFMFAAAGQVPRVMVEFERKVLAMETPCAGMSPERLASALARTHAELMLIHPFREGNGRCARLLSLLMAMQAGMPTLDFWSFAGRGRRRYLAAIQAALGGDCVPPQACFTRAIRTTLKSFEGQP